MHVNANEGLSFHEGDLDGITQTVVCLMPLSLSYVSRMKNCLISHIFKCARLEQTSFTHMKQQLRFTTEPVLSTIVGSGGMLRMQNDMLSIRMVFCV